MEEQNNKGTTNLFLKELEFLHVGDVTRKGYELNQLADFLYENVYQHPQVAQARRDAQVQLEFLFNTFVAAPGKLPSRYQLRLKEQPVHRTVCDYLAGMTDRYCRETYLAYR